MTTFSHEIEIEAPVDYVFEWGTTPENWMRATPSLRDVEEIEQTDEGIRYHNVMSVLGREIETEELFVIDEENGHTRSLIDDDDMSGTVDYWYEEIPAGTRVRMEADFDLGGSLFDRAIEPVLGRYVKRQFRQSQETMRELIEAEYAADDRKLAQA